MALYELGKVIVNPAADMLDIWNVLLSTAAGTPPTEAAPLIATVTIAAVPEPVPTLVAVKTVPTAVEDEPIDVQLVVPEATI